MRKQFFSVLILTAVLAALSGCDEQDFLTASRQTLWANRAAWMDIQDLVAEKHEQGAITDAQYGEMQALDARYIAAHNTAVLALDEYERLKDENSKTIVISLLADVGDILDQAREMIAAWKKETP